jgi:ketosteroid isomerase-like protein
MTLDRLREFGEAWAAGDVDALMTFMTDDCVYRASVGPEPGTTYRGRDAVRQGFAEMLAYDHGRERHDGAALIAGNVGVADWSFTEAKPDGGTTTIRGCDIFEFADGKIRKKDAFRKVFGTVPARVAGHEPVTHREVE